MRLRLFSSLCMFIAACSDGPETPHTFEGPAVALTFNFKDLPNAEIGSAALRVDPVSFPPGSYAPQAFCLGPMGVLEEFVADRARFQIPSFGNSASAYERAACEVGVPLALHFFKAIAFLSHAGATGSRVWTPGAYDLVYAPEPTVFRPFGPSGPETTFPTGYSWLHRGCGPTGASELSVVSIDQVLDLHPVDIHEYSIESTERNVVAACGVPHPAVDIGTRVAFGRARELAWAADGASLYYLPFDDEQDQTGGLGVRQVHLSEQTVSEIAVIPQAEYLQTGPSGVLYVTSETEAMYAIPPSSGTPASPQEVPPGGPGNLSPDGLWIAHTATTGDVFRVHLWSVAAGAEVAVLDGAFLGWSPDSRLLYGPDFMPVMPSSPEAQVPYELFMVAPATPDQPVKCGAVSKQARMQGIFAWGASGCPELVYRPLSWSIESTVPLAACEGCFGLSVLDPLTGAERALLGASSGLVSTAYTHPVVGFSFAWARTCQGLYNTICSYSLLRVRLADGLVETVATADQVLPMALSWDSRKIALAGGNGIYIKDLP